ncbi:MAG: hypothetical protein CMG41_04165 [Candidatus Marinimicrobia bacterium]|nr:hypothetical protein [Candidatus Neomarinimicrobiota bacterium]
MKKNKMKISFLFLCLIQFVWGQNYDLPASQFTGGQANSSSDSFNLSSNTISQSAEFSSSDSFSLSQGIMSVTQGLYALPPVVNASIADTIYRDGMPIRVQGILTDLNGIASADLHLQQGGSTESIVIPMVALNDSIYEVSIAESLVTIKNFRAFIRGDDNMAYTGESQKLTPSVKYGERELTTLIENSIYPNGIPTEKWRMLSFPGDLDNPLIENPKDEGHVFYVWDLDDSAWIVPDSIYPGHAYWFKHIYENAVPFSSDSGMAIPLEPYTISLKNGWNMVGSPFAFPVEVSANPNEVSALYFFGDSTNRDGWSLQEYRMDPWAGYAVYTDLDSATIELLPFPIEDEENTTNRIAGEGWTIVLSAESERYIDKTMVIGRHRNAKDVKDGMDIPLLPSLSKGLSLALSLDNGTRFNHSSDIRSIDEQNGVWNLSVFSSSDPGPVQFSVEGSIAAEIGVAVLDIQTRKIYTDVLVNPFSIDDRLSLAYELKFVVGDPAYIESMLLEILSQIPSEFALGQNYPNPFNPITRLDYLLPRRSDVSIRVYNMLGQEIITLLRQEQPYGKYSVSWNGLDKSGKQVASGVYFTELKAGSIRKTRKMLLLK